MDGEEAKKTTFQLVLIKPTHYDDDGYPITWLRSHIPSNTLAALYGLGEDCRKRQALGPDIDIVIKPFDETNPRVRPEIQAAMDMGISIFAGEAEENRLDIVMRDARDGKLKPLYRYTDDLPGLEGAPSPSLPPAALARNEGRKSSFDLGRGCPFQC